MRIFKAPPLNQFYFDYESLSFIDKLFIKQSREIPDFNKSMFDEDFARIFRPKTRRRNHLFSIESNNEQLTQRLLGNIKSTYRTHSADEAIFELVTEIAQSLIWCGSAYYYLYDNHDQGETHLIPFTESCVLHFFNLYVQFIPRRQEEYMEINKKEFPRELRILDSTKLIHFSMPISIKKILSKQNQVLALLDKHEHGKIDSMIQAAYKKPSPNNYFDFRVWKDMQERALYRSTRDTGWNGRNYNSPKHSDFFTCHRLIRFRRNQLIMRDHILLQLSNELTRVGRRYSKGFHVAISTTKELPKIVELEELAARLSKEDVSFTEILDFCYER
jgi:hypothetical protein